MGKRKDVGQVRRQVCIPLVLTSGIMDGIQAGLLETMMDASSGYELLNIALLFAIHMEQAEEAEGGRCRGDSTRGGVS